MRVKDIARSTWRYIRRKMGAKPWGELTSLSQAEVPGLIVVNNSF